MVVVAVSTAPRWWFGVRVDVGEGYWGCHEAKVGGGGIAHVPIVINDEGTRSIKSFIINRIQ